MEKLAQEREQNYEKLIYQQNEKFQEDIKRLRDKEGCLFISNETELRRIGLLEEKMKDQERELKYKCQIIDISDKEKNYNKEMDIDKYKLAFDKVHENEKKELRELKVISDDNIKLIKEYKESFLIIKEENISLINKENELKKTIEHNEISLKTIVNENNVIKEEIKSIHSTLKSTSRKLDMKIVENISLEKQISHLKR